MVKTMHGEADFVQVSPVGGQDGHARCRRSSRADHVLRREPSSGDVVVMLGRKSLLKLIVCFTIRSVTC
jgi:hypothetical protein